MPSVAAATRGFVFSSDLGYMALAWTEDRLSRLTFGRASAAAAIADLEASAGECCFARANDLPAWIATLVEQLQAYAAGDAVVFGKVPLDETHLTRFGQEIIAACRAIPRGNVRTYAQLAASAGSPGAARAVGNVMAQNRFPIIVPCHRVVGSSGSLGGFSAPDGITMKRRMLTMEGAMEERIVRPVRRQKYALA